MCSHKCCTIVSACSCVLLFFLDILQKKTQFANKYSIEQCYVCPGSGGQQVLLVTLPRFSSSGSLVLVNLRTLAVHPIQFDADVSA